MKTLITALLLVSSSFAQAATCTYTLVNASGAIVAQGEQQADFEKSQIIPNTQFGYTLESIRQSPDTYLEFVSVTRTEKGATQTLRCDDTDIVVNSIYVGVKATCSLENNNAIVVGCKF